MAASLLPQPIDRRIVTIRTRPVLLDSDLARILGVPLRQLRELISCHPERFPGELCFQPDASELPPDYTHTKPNAFTEAGAWMACLLLPRFVALSTAIEISRAVDRYRTRMTDRPAAFYLR